MISIVVVVVLVLMRQDVVAVLEVAVSTVEILIRWIDAALHRACTSDQSGTGEGRRARSAFAVQSGYGSVVSQLPLSQTNLEFLGSAGCGWWKAEVPRTACCLLLVQGGGAVSLSCSCASITDPCKCQKSWQQSASAGLDSRWAV